MAISSTKSLAKPAARTKKTPAVEPVVKKGAFGRPIVPGAQRKPPAAKRKPPVKFVFTAPEGLKSCFVLVSFRTSKDGFIAPGCAVELIRGKWDNDNAPSYDLFAHDYSTATTLVARLMMLTYAPNPIRRFAPNTSYEVLIRLGVARADNSVRASVRLVWRSTDKKGQTLVEITDKKDQELRKLRRAGKFLAGSFTKCVSLDALKAIEKEELRLKREADKEEAKAQRLAEREAARAAKASSRSSRAAPEAKARARR